MHGASAAQGELLAEVSGRYRREAEEKSDFPVVGDWVAITPRQGDGRATIHGLLTRSSAFVRKAANGAGAWHTRAQEQVVAANIDTVLIVMALDHDFNVRRLERYLTLAWGSGVQPVVVLNKADLCGALAERLAETEEAAVGVPVLTMSAETGAGVEALLAHLGAGRTAAFLGSSGVGKSTLINRLLGAPHMATAAVRDDDGRGRHTTTHRELIVPPSGALLIDNPGMREVGIVRERGGPGRRLLRHRLALPRRAGSPTAGTGASPAARCARRGRTACWRRSAFRAGESCRRSLRSFSPGTTCRPARRSAGC